MRVEVLKFVGQDICIRDEVEVTASEALLHLPKVVTKTLLSSNFVTLWEVVDALVLVEALVEKTLARASRP